MITLKKRKERTGIVVGDKMQKTIVVKVGRITRHPVYGRVIRRFNKFKVHDENNTAKAGDTVLIQETRPISKDKYWRLVRIIKKAQKLDLLEELDEKDKTRSEKKAKVKKENEEMQ